MPAASPTARSGKRRSPLALALVSVLGSCTIVAPVPPVPGGRADIAIDAATAVDGPDNADSMIADGTESGDVHSPALPCDASPVVAAYMASLAPWTPKCAVCHAKAGATSMSKSGPLWLVAGPPEATIAQLLRLGLVRHRWQTSPLLWVLVPPAEGGSGHTGGWFLHVGEADWQVLAAFVQAAAQCVQ